MLAALASASLHLAFAPDAHAQIYDPTEPPKPKPKPASRPAKPKPRDELRVLYTSDVYGRFAWPGCARARNHKLQGLNGDFAHLVGALAKLRERAKRAGAKTVTVAGGSMTRMDIMGPFAFRSDTYAKDAVSLVAAAKFDGVSVGLFDVGSRLDHQRRYFNGLADHKVSALAANVECPSKSPRCKALRRAVKPYVVVERSGLRVGIFSVVRDDLLARILPLSRSDLTVRKTVKRARKIVEELRGKHKVDLVVMLANVNLESVTPQPVVDLVGALSRPQHRVDVVVANAMFERDGDRYTSQLRIANGPVIVGTDRFGQTVGELTLKYSREGKHVRVLSATVKRHAAVGFDPPKKHYATGLRLLDGLCRRFDVQLGPATLDKPIERKEFMRYLLQVMRLQTRSEIALLNHSATADTSFPMKGRLTVEKLLRTIRTSARLGTVNITGSRVKALLAKHRGIGGDLAVLGLQKKGTKWLVNGRSLVSGDTYRVALTSFVAAGGDSLVKFREKFHSAGRTLRTAIARFLKRGGSKRDGNPALSSDKDFPKLNDKWLFSLGTSVGFGLSNVSVFNNNKNGAARYELPLLRRDDLTVVSVDARFDFAALTRDHAIESQVQLQYSRTYTGPQFANNTIEAEALDRILATASYRMRALRRVLGKHWYTPEPYAEAILITEFTPSGSYAPDPNQPDVLDEYHYADLSGVIGVGLQLHPLFFVKLGFAQRGELFTPEASRPESTHSRGIYLGYQLRRWKIVAHRDHPLSLESRLDFYMTALTASVRFEGTAQTQVSFGLWRMLSLLVTHRFYFFDNRRESIAFANDISVALGVVLDYRRQTF